MPEIGNEKGAGVTHEDPHNRPLAEHGGPEHDDDLPDATAIPEYTDVEASLAPTMINIAAMGTADQPDYIGAEPGWWLETGDVADNPAQPPPGYGSVTNASAAYWGPDQPEPGPGALQSFWLNDRY